MKKEKGITLIALVVTIIILLILVGVTLSQLVRNGLFSNADLAREEYDKSSATELLNIKLSAYRTEALSNDKEITLQNLKDYYKDDQDTEYIKLYKGTLDDLISVAEGEQAGYAKIKLENYKYVFIINEKLKIVQIEGEESNRETGEIVIDDELQRLLNEANRQITLNDILNTPAIMNEVPGLIPILTENDVTRREEDGIITYQDTSGGTIRTSSEYPNSNNTVWHAFDGKEDTRAVSDVGLEHAQGYYIEYEFSQEVYAMKIKYRFTNISSSIGERVIIIQGYNEGIAQWEDLGEEKQIKGKDGTFEEQNEVLNYAKAYKRYRFYVKSATASDSYGAAASGLYSMQLYGILSSDVDENSEDRYKQLLLAFQDRYTITLEKMATNSDFITKLINDLSIQTIENNAILMEKLPALIPIVKESDITKSEQNGIITYTRLSGGTIRTTSEHSSGNCDAWHAFDGDENKQALSKEGEAQGYYVEYQFPQEVYAMKIKYKFTNGASYVGNRIVVIQGYNEEIAQWEDLNEEKEISGKSDTFEEQKEILNYAKAYKRYRFYVKSATASNAYGASISGLYNMQLYGKTK